VNKFSEDLIRSLSQAVAHAEGKKPAARVHVADVPDVRKIREELNMSQQEFASAFRIPLPTIKNWEQGRRQPDAPAAAFLLAIAKCPKEIRLALAPAA
jgi:putative transcriptional regulator